ncbi:MAG: S24 family peptidase, partial [Acidobacteriota bacterium]|nr:S24 family peptidase [Acidobacteriota bacterium]
RPATWSLAEIARPGTPPEPWGILLVGEKEGDVATTMRFRRPSELGDLEEDEFDFLDFLEADLKAKAAERGGAVLLANLEDSLSNYLRISERTAIAVSGNPQRTVDRLFDEYVDSTVRPFVTHLPVYNLRAAATKFGEGMQSEQEGWVRVPESLRVSEDLFVAHVVGRSMEPLIADGNRCVFRAGVKGARQGKRLLIEQFGETDFASRYTVKRYTSVKSYDEDGEFTGHERIRLEPLNREFPAFDLGPDEFRVIAEFVEVLD